MKLIDLTGERFGRLVVVSRAEDGAGYKSRWRCKCDCGAATIVHQSHLRSGHTRSCGCNSGIQHGLSNKSSEYDIWALMRQRCMTTTDPAYKNYGARGIAVCERWNDFRNFLLDMGPRPSPKHSIERKNNDCGYEPDNCVWLEKRLQSRNRRGNVLTNEVAAELRKLRNNGGNVAAWARSRGIVISTAQLAAAGKTWSD